MLIPLNEENLRRAARCLASGGLVAFPTETVYGLGADAFNERALARIFAVKRRPFFDPLIVHIASLAALPRLVDVSALGGAGRERLDALSRALWPGPLTLVLPKLPEVPGLATGGLATVAVRFPSHEGAAALIRLSTGAVAAPSANPFGSLSPTRAQHVERTLGDAVDLILDGGPTEIGVESTVLDLSEGCPRILRPGGASAEAIEAVVGPVRGADNPLDSSAAPPASVRSPGQLKGHYAPATALVLADGLRGLARDDECAYLFFSRESYGEEGGAKNVFILSEAGELIEAAARLFDVLHDLDGGLWSCIYTERAPQEGLGCAINDRLAKAAAGSAGFTHIPPELRRK
ncbi:MAG: threonylcarbamoyl-AMP synthase [Spirochaetaceae bacterium]|jgi:L-threonylcarbamoyladenylate synthase|nr:threonylcarbamoyl-AMP synthase [Spirochaetaceae bacterium]